MDNTLQTSVAQIACAFDARTDHRIRLIEHRRRYILRVRQDCIGLASTLAPSIDIPLNTLARSAEEIAMRVGPDEWLLVGSIPDMEAIKQRIESVFGGRHYALVDVSDRNVGLELSGPSANVVLQSGCPIDFADTAFTSGTAVRTVLGKAEIIVARPDGEPKYLIECWRSYLPYVERYLQRAVDLIIPGDQTSFSMINRVTEQYTA
jgi:sarcosine oxidase, subunit gamma